MTELPIAPVSRILKNSGATRVSEESAQYLTEVLEDIGEEIAGKAVDLARHAGRKTVKKDDIELAVKNKCKC